MRKARRKLLTIETAPGQDQLRQASFSGDLSDDRKAINVVPPLGALNSFDAEMIRRPALAPTCLLLLPAVPHPLQHWWHLSFVTDTDRSALTT